MPLPRGLKFDDRIAPYAHPKRGAGHLFICQRVGHGYYEEFIPGFKSDAKSARTQHDTEFHVYGRRRGQLRPILIDQLCTEYFEHMEKLEVEGKRDPATTRHYYLAMRYIREGMKAVGVHTHLDLDSSRISDFIRWMRNNSKSQGALIVDVLSAFRTMLRWKWIPVDWRIPHDEIRAEKREKLDLDSATIRKIIAAMPAGSLEEAASYLKARTGARDVEIYKSKKEEFDLDLQLELDGRKVAIGVFRPILHNKGRATKKRHVYVLTSDAVEKVRPFVKRATAGGYVFAEADGRHVTAESMRPRIRAASKRAGFLKMKKDAMKRKPVRIGGIDSIAQIRAEVATIVEGEASLQEAAEQLGHADPRTTARWYLKSRVTRRKLIERYRPAEIIARAIPLGSTGRNARGRASGGKRASSSGSRIA